MTASANDHQGTYLSAMGRDWLLPLYDPLCRLLRMAALHRPLIEQAGLRQGHRVLEIGCGTGNLVIMAAGLHPDAEITGLDPDPKALARARRKAARRGRRVRLDQGFAETLPYADGSFDRILSSFMFHHLEPDAKAAALREARRVLTPGGSFHLMDAGGAIAASDGWMARKALTNPHLQDNLGDRIPTLLREAGFTDAHEVDHRATRIVGRVTYVRATNP
jgi:ubiquinone/menaquinone biosynthesis C-methylase UbiE